MKTIEIMKRIIRQTVNDKRSLGMILIVPLFLFTLIYFLLGDSDYKATIAENGMPTALIENIKAEGVTVNSYTLDEGKAAVKNKKVDALIYIDGNETNLLFESNDAVKTGVVMKAVQKAIKEYVTATMTASALQNTSAMQNVTPIDPAMKDISSLRSLNTKFIYGKSDDSMFNSMGYVMMGIISFFLIFILAGISFVRERTNQTMERLMVTPVKRWQVILGYTLGFGIFAMLQSIILLIYVKFVLNMTITGSLVAAGTIMILLAITAVCIGAFCSIYANNEFQIMQFIPVVVIPQIFFSGLISLDTLPYHLGVVSKVLPVYYACHALQKITIKGADLAGVLSDVAALFVFVALFFVLNTLALKKYRRI